jgi:hypothetical protein
MEQMAVRAPETVLALAHLQGTVFDAWMRQNIEAMDFLKARFERDRQLAVEIAGIKDASEAVALWTTFWQRAVEDYADEPRRVASLMASAARDALSNARHEAEGIMKTASATAV